MSLRRRGRSLLENFAGVLTAGAGVGMLLLIFWMNREQITTSWSSPVPGNGTPIQAGAVSAQDLQQRLDDIEAKKQAIEDARLAEIKAAEEAKRRAAEEKRRAEEAAREAAEKAAREKAEQAAAAKAAAEKAAEEKVAREKAIKFAAEQAAAEKAAKEKAAKEKAAAEKAAKEKAAKEKAAKEAAAKAAAEKAAKAKAAKAAQEKAKLDAIGDGPSLGLSSYDDEAARNDAIGEFTRAVEAKMKRYWTLPPNIPANLKATLVIRIDRKGRVQDVRVSRSSGYPIFDSKAMEAIRDASPLPLPGNQSVVDELVREGVLFNFQP